VFRPALLAHHAQWFNDSFCQLDPVVAQNSRASSHSVSRADLLLVIRPSLILQCCEDAIAPLEAGGYVHGAIHGSTWLF